MPDQIVAVLNSTDNLLGVMGLGIETTNFTDVEKPTFLSTLADIQNLIPSRSYGYTAGAYYCGSRDSCASFLRVDNV